MKKDIGTLVVPPSDLAKQRKLKPRSRLTLTTEHPGSHGLAVLTYAQGEILDGVKFRSLRDMLGATIETDDAVKVCGALRVPVGERGVVSVTS